MRKIYLVPNFVTTANLFCGFYSVIASSRGDFEGAAQAILAAAVFDLLDGRIARLAKATSQFGLEYDSLSDLMSFGVAPAILAYEWMLESFDRLGWLAAFLFVACGAMRLARFNAFSGVIAKSHFQGLPIPAAAGTMATYLLFTRALSWDVSAESMRFSVLGMTLALSSLMVSTVLFPSFKEFHWRSSASFGYLMIGVLLMILIAVRPEVTLFLVLSSYISLSFSVYSIRWLARRFRKKTLRGGRGVHPV